MALSIRHYSTVVRRSIRRTLGFKDDYQEEMHEEVDPDKVINDWTGRKQQKKFMKDYLADQAAPNQRRGDEYETGARLRAYRSATLKNVNDR